MEEEFLLAVYTGESKAITRCIKNGVNVNVRNSDNQTALHLVAEKTDLRTCKQLLDESRINVDAQDEIGVTPLMLACFNGDRHMVELLLMRGAYPDVKDKYESTALHYAVKNGSLPNVSTLTYNRAYISANNVFDDTPLSLALIDYPNYDIAKFLLRKGARFNTPKNMPMLLEACLNCNSEPRLQLIRLLVQTGKMDIDREHPKTKMNCLHYAALTGYYPLASYLVQKGANYAHRDLYGRTPTDVARIHNHSEVLQLLISKEAKVSESKPSSFQLPSSSKSI